MPGRPPSVTSPSAGCGRQSPRLTPPAKPPLHDRCNRLRRQGRAHALTPQAAKEGPSVMCSAQLAARGPRAAQHRFVGCGSDARTSLLCLLCSSRWMNASSPMRRRSCQSAAAISLRRRPPLAKPNSDTLARVSSKESSRREQLSA